MSDSVSVAASERLLEVWPRPSWRTSLTAVTLVGLLVWGWRGTDASAAEFLTGLPSFLDFLTRLWPPAFEMQQVELAGWELPFPVVITKIIETVQMAIVGTLLAILLSVPFGLLAARNLAPHRSVYAGTRLLLNANRAVPEIIFGILFVAQVGPGPFSGVLALAVGSVGSLGKIYAESIEAIDPQPVLAVRATGAGSLATFLYGVLPQALPVMASYSLLLFEHNVRAAAILGLVGAGGIGFLLQRYLGLFQYKELCAAILVIFIVVTLLDRVTDRIRRRII